MMVLEEKSAAQQRFTDWGRMSVQSLMTLLLITDNHNTNHYQLTDMSFYVALYLIIE